MTAPGGIAWRAVSFYDACFGGGGALSATVHEDITRRDGALPGNGALTATLTAQLPTATQFAGVGKLVVNVWNAATGPQLNTTLEGAGTLTATATAIMTIAATFTGGGALSLATRPVRKANAFMGGGGALSAAAVTSPVLAGLRSHWILDFGGARFISITNNFAPAGGYAVYDIASDVALGVPTVIYGGVQMRLLTMASGGGPLLARYVLENPPTGAQTVTASWGAATVARVGAVCLTFGNVAAITAPQISSTYSTSITNNVSSPPGGVIVNSAAIYASGAVSPSMSGGTYRFSSGLAGGIAALMTNTATESTVFVSSNPNIGSWATLADVLIGGDPVKRFTGTGTLTASVRSTEQSADLTGDGVLSAEMRLFSIGAPVEFAGTGTLAAPSYLYSIHQAPALTGAGTLSATVKPKTAAALSGSGSLSATAEQVIATPTFDAVSAGYGGSTPSYTHTLGASAKAIVIAIHLFTNHASPTLTVGVSGGAGTPTQLAVRSTHWGSGYYIHTYLYGLLNPATGERTITASSVGGSTKAWAVSSTSWTNVTSFSAGSNTSGSGTSMSHSVSSATNRRIVQAFAATDPQTIGSYNQTSRANRAGSAGVNAPLLLGDAAGAASVSFTATLPISSIWHSVAVSLIG